ncbi:Clp protease N-terminal domain-containing protein [Pseudonocardia xinjiangensis]|uniref:Clp protease N-terminal domain-containing protein n=1 Tax=Pseudonocardia xinjiangensis TaxID=75289 RepID=UPI003D9248B7
MFERFTEKARLVVVGAQEQARERGADAIRSEHLLAALFAVPDNLAITVLGALGVDRDVVEAEVGKLRPDGTPVPDAEALATLGIDLDEVRRQVEEAFGPGALDRTRAAAGRRPRGHIPFDRTAKKVMELALREALRLKHNYIGTEHILLGMLHSATGAAHDILVSRGVRQDATRIIVEELVRGRRAG